MIRIPGKIQDLIVLFWLSSSSAYHQLLKRNLTGDFRFQVFFMDQFPLGPVFRVSHFEFYTKICGDIRHQR
jgi:hypothetical protein